MIINAPLISVILPVYNGEKHLSECIESILSQTFQDFEFIIVDDASTDNTPQLLKEYAKKDTRIKIVTHSINQKQTVAANTACKYAKGKYIARMDADDIALPNRFIKQVTFLEENITSSYQGLYDSFRSALTQFSVFQIFVAYFSSPHNFKE